MKKFIYLFTLLLMCSFTLQAQEWQKYKAEDLEFVSYFPGEAERSLDKVQTAVGEVDMHMVSLSPTDDKNLTYAVIQSAYPENSYDYTDETRIKNMLDGATSGAVTNVQGALIYENVVQFNGFPARDLKVEIEGGFIYIKTILVNNKMYILQVICETDHDNNSSIERFFNSFELIKVQS